MTPPLARSGFMLRDCAWATRLWALLGGEGGNIVEKNLLSTRKKPRSALQGCMRGHRCGSGRSCEKSRMSQ